MDFILKSTTGAVIRTGTSDTFVGFLRQDLASLGSADLKGANLSGADLKGANLTSASLTSADLSGADLSGADLSGADLRGANLHGASLRYANLRGADLRYANLRYANLDDSDLRDANLEDSDLRGADFTRCRAVLPAGEPDGWTCVGWLNGDLLNVRVGCRNTGYASGVAYWTGKPDRQEVLAALVYVRAVAVLRGWNVD